MSTYEGLSDIPEPFRKHSKVKKGRSNTENILLLLLIYLLFSEY